MSWRLRGARCSAQRPAAGTWQRSDSNHILWVHVKPLSHHSQATFVVVLHEGHLVSSHGASVLAYWWHISIIIAIWRKERPKRRFPALTLGRLSSFMTSHRLHLLFPCPATSHWSVASELNILPFVPLPSKPVFTLMQIFPKMPASLLIQKHSLAVVSGSGTNWRSGQTFLKVWPSQFGSKLFCHLMPHSSSHCHLRARSVPQSKPLHARSLWTCTLSSPLTPTYPTSSLSKCGPFLPPHSPKHSSTWQLFQSVCLLFTHRICFPSPHPALCPRKQGWLP